MRLTDINPVKKKDVKRRVSGILASMNTESVFPTRQALHPGLRKAVGSLEENIPVKTVWKGTHGEGRTERNRTLKVGPQLDRNRRMPSRLLQKRKTSQNQVRQLSGWGLAEQPFKRT